MMSKNTVGFTISVVGDTTGEKWVGEFRALQRLSHRLQLIRDQKRRELLGPDAANATPRARNQAEIFSELHVRLVEAPKWWTEYGDGLDLEDDNLIVAVHTKALEIEQQAAEEVKKKGEAARAELKAEVEKDNG